VKLVCDCKTAKLDQKVGTEINKINELISERDVDYNFDNFQNTGLTSMKVKVSLFPQLKSQDKKACLPLQG